MDVLLTEMSAKMVLTSDKGYGECWKRPLSYIGLVIADDDDENVQ